MLSSVHAMVGVSVFSSVQINIFGDEVVFRLKITCEIKRSGFDIQHVLVVFALCLLLLS